MTEPIQRPASIVTSGSRLEESPRLADSSDLSGCSSLAKGQFYLLATLLFEKFLS
jgi:hypothetical protein